MESVKDILVSESQDTRFWKKSSAWPKATYIAFRFVLSMFMVMVHCQMQSIFTAAVPNAPIYFIMTSTSYYTLKLLKLNITMVDFL
jgi:hypothetical protein